MSAWSWQGSSGLEGRSIFYPIVEGCHEKWEYSQHENAMIGSGWTTDSWYEEQITGEELLCALQCQPHYLLLASSCWQDKGSMDLGPCFMTEMLVFPCWNPCHGHIRSGVCVLREGMVLQLVSMTVPVFRLLVDWSQTIALDFSVPQYTTWVMLGPFLNSLSFDLQTSELLEQVPGSEEWHWLDDDVMNALSVQSSRKQRFNFGKCPVPTYKITLHTNRGWNHQRLSLKVREQEETKEKHADLVVEILQK